MTKTNLPIHELLDHLNVWVIETSSWANDGSMFCRGLIDGIRVGLLAHDCPDLNPDEIIDEYGDNVNERDNIDYVKGLFAGALAVPGVVEILQAVPEEGEGNV